MICNVTLTDAVLNIGTTGIEKINGLIFTHKVEKLYRVRGSFHKYKNNGLHNADDYFLSDFKNTLNQLYEKMDLNPEITPLNAFEFGVNIKLPFNPTHALKCIILHKNNKGNWNKKDNLKVFTYDNYSDKFYNKSELTEIEPFKSEYILRFEIHISRMTEIKRIMTYTKLSDLLDSELWERFEMILIKTINECLIIDFTDDEISLLSDKEQIQYYKYINDDYWQELYKLSKSKGERTNDSRIKRAAYKLERKECDKFINQHSKSTLKTLLINKVSEKCQELRDVSTANEIEKKWYKLHTFENEKGTNYTVDKRVICTKTETTETDDEKHCLSCGKVIPNPRFNQSYCSAKNVGYEQAHKCRNSSSNPRNNTKKSIRRVLSIPLMFDLSETIAPDKRMYL